MVQNGRVDCEKIRVGQAFSIYPGECGHDRYNALINDFLNLGIRVNPK